MSNYCERHGHQAPIGAPKDSRVICMNCGNEFHHEPPNVPVTIAALADAFMGGGKPNTKPSNPKDAVGTTKLPMHLVPTAVPRYAALAFAEGALKYGKYNWRVAGVRLSIYLDAIHRHLSKLQDGEWADGDSLGFDENGERQGTGVPHLASVIACAGIILDALECDKLTDDRPPVNAFTSHALDKEAVPHLAHLRKLFVGYSPHQHVISDETPLAPKD